MLFRRKSALLRHTEVPPGMAENFILSGYRFPNCSFGECLGSAFQPTNETGNFWTHFLALFVFAFYFLELFWWEQAAPVLDPIYYPFWSYFIGVCGLLVVSSMAHLFNSMSMVVREICFFVDYGTISAYTVGSSLAYFYYINPRTGLANEGSLPWLDESRGQAPSVDELSPLVSWCPAWLLPMVDTFTRVGWWFEALYVPTACVIALLCTMACCNSRQQWPRYRYIIRTLVFLLPFVVVSAPVFYKLYVGARNGSLGLFFTRHCFWLLISGVFNISKIPERFSPGKFDIWGHSHQWFHFCTFMSILDELHMIKGEIKGLAGELPKPPTFLSTFGVMLLLLLVLSAIVVWFAVKVHAMERKPKAQ
ncbi:membrane progesterone receptor epsilon-like [Ambystoma mexicanum]|uniref:membrane progesterone receptor epsilon-like n=1 Tax=Ambystoma mexicanum TaxID=8296 RepID=UPI0037E7B4EC